MSEETLQEPPFQEHVTFGPAVGEGATPEEIGEALKAVYDPEIGINIVDLGLLYGVTKTEEGEVNVQMTLTSPACPLGPVIIDQVQYVAGRPELLKPTEVTLVLDDKELRAEQTVYSDRGSSVRTGSGNHGPT